MELYSITFELPFKNLVMYTWALNLESLKEYIGNAKLANVQLIDRAKDIAEVLEINRQRKIYRWTS